MAETPPVPRPLPRYLAFEQKEDIRKIDAILVEVGEIVPAEQRSGKPLRASADGHRSDRSRGLPIISKGIGGTMPGTDPLGALLAKERRRQL